MARLLLGIIVVAVVVTVYALIDCAMMQKSRVRGLPKAAWIFVILLIPIIGLLLWFIIGRGSVSQAPAAAPPRRAPDDDASFLGSISKREQDERIRRMEEELAALDDDQGNDSDGGQGPHDSKPHGGRGPGTGPDSASDSGPTNA